MWTLAPDKQMHIALGALISGSVTAATKDPWAGFLAGSLAGVGKEVVDLVGRTYFNGTGTPDWKDAVATIAGAGVPLVNFTF